MSQPLVTLLLPVDHHGTPLRQRVRAILPTARYHDCLLVRTDQGEIPMAPEGLDRFAPGWRALCPRYPSRAKGDEPMP